MCENMLFMLISRSLRKRLTPWNDFLNGNLILKYFSI